MTTILIVDDEPDLLAELEPLLARLGHDVQTAVDGEVVLQQPTADAAVLILFGGGVIDDDAVILQP